MAQRVSELVAAARAAIAACDGGQLVARALRGPHWRYAWIWAVGKAARAMARETGGGFVIDATRAGHPFPDERSVAAGEQLLHAAAAVPAEERALLLLSGGASALVAVPVDGLTLAELSATTRALMHGGASIHELNVVRRHLTKLGGGKLATACPGAIDVLALSDVAGDGGAEPGESPSARVHATIGSGPASPEPASRDAALAIARRFGAPEAALAVLERVGENPHADAACFARGTYRILASPETLRDEAVRTVAATHLHATAWPTLIAGDVDDVAVDLAAAARTLKRGEALVAVGEPTVRVRGNGVGGRAQHLALALAAPLSSTDLAFVAVGSDGRDGPTDAAGAFVDGRTLAQFAARNVDAAAALGRCDSHRALAAVGAVIPAYDSGTNLTDLYILARG
jgi:hydroxypyruvate reductase